MKATQELHRLGQSLGSIISREICSPATRSDSMRTSCQLQTLTSDPTIFDHAIKNSTAYDAAIQSNVRKANRRISVFLAKNRD